jgi:hypothetical protein
MEDALSIQLLDTVHLPSETTWTPPRTVPSSGATNEVHATPRHTRATPGDTKDSNPERFSLIENFMVQFLLVRKYMVQQTKDGKLRDLF